MLCAQALQEALQVIVTTRIVNVFILVEIIWSWLHFWIHKTTNLKWYRRLEAFVPGSWHQSAKVSVYVVVSLSN